MDIRNDDRPNVDIGPYDAGDTGEGCQRDEDCRDGLGCRWNAPGCGPEFQFGVCGEKSALDGDGGHVFCDCDGVTHRGWANGPWAHYGSCPNCMGGSGSEGSDCNPDLTCDLPGLRCLELSPDYSDPADQVFRCIRECTTDADCEGAEAGRLCRPVVFDLLGCVANEMQEGLPISLSCPLVTGCASGLTAIPAWLGAISLLNDELTCGRPCDPSKQVGQPGGCTARYPYCNPQILTSTPTGICALRRSLPGDICSRTSVVGTCDTAPTPLGNPPTVLCVVGIETNGRPPAFVDPYDPSPDPDPGMCTALCDPTPLTPSPNELLDDCSHADDPGLPPATCALAFDDDDEFGICSVGCFGTSGSFPDRCRRLGAFGLGSNCSEPYRFDPNADSFSFCKNVVPPMIEEWDGVNNPAVDCLDVPGGENRCPAGTICIENNGAGVCGRGCDPQATPTGCERSTVGTSSCSSHFCAP